MCYTYDSLNRVTKRTVRNLCDNSVISTETFTYDAAGNVTDAPDSCFRYDTNCKLSKLLCKTTNGITTKYVYGLGLIGEEKQGCFKTYHFDCRGSTVAITNSDGNITDTFAYDTYGRLVSRTGTSFVIFGYNGRDGVITDKNGLIYMRARYYSPEMKRFVNADIVAGQISTAVTLNRFAYANGNPVSLVDPLGLSPERNSGYVEFTDPIKTSIETKDPPHIFNSNVQYVEKSNCCHFSVDVHIIEDGSNKKASWLEIALMIVLGPLSLTGCSANNDPYIPAGWNETFDEALYNGLQDAYNQAKLPYINHEIGGYVFERDGGFYYIIDYENATEISVTIKIELRETDKLLATFHTHPWNPDPSTNIVFSQQDFTCMKERKVPSYVVVENGDVYLLPYEAKSQLEYIKADYIDLIE